MHQLLRNKFQDSVSMMSGGTVDDTIQNVPRADRIQAKVTMAVGRNGSKNLAKGNLSSHGVMSQLQTKGILKSTWKFPWLSSNQVSKSTNLEINQDSLISSLQNNEST